MGRIVAIRHRRKKTSEGEARPTVAAIKLENGKIVCQEMEDDDAEKDFLLHDLKPGDKVAMVLGGSGDRFAAALSRKGEDIGTTVYRIPPYSLADNRNGEDKDNDHLTLARLLENSPNLFYQVRRRDRDVIRVKELFSARMDAMKSRIACEQRILQSLVGKIFLNEEGCFPEGAIEQAFDEAKANDAILQALIVEEDRRYKELDKAVRSTEIYKKVFDQVKGAGGRIAAAIIAAVSDIRRFMVTTGDNKAMRTAAKLKKFCGVHVMEDGRFARRRSGSVANWSPQARQALYLLADQFNRQGDSTIWGKKFLENKLRLREKHPEPVKRKNGDGKIMKDFTNGHIHNMAKWRTLTRFVEWMTKQWIAIEE